MPKTSQQQQQGKDVLLALGFPKMFAFLCDICNVFIYSSAIGS